MFAGEFETGIKRAILAMALLSWEKTSGVLKSSLCGGFSRCIASASSVRIIWSPFISQCTIPFFPHCHSKSSESSCTSVLGFLYVVVKEPCTVRTSPLTTGSSLSPAPFRTGMSHLLRTQYSHSQHRRTFSQCRLRKLTAHPHIVEVDIAHSPHNVTPNTRHHSRHLSLSRPCYSESFQLGR
jgi:hypothetical protein